MTIRMVVYLHSGGSVVSKYLKAFCDGMKRHDVALSTCKFPNHKPADIAVCWGHRRQELYTQQKKAGAHYLVMERGFIGDRTRFTSLGYDGLNNRADFVVENMPGDRFKKYFKTLMAPWKNGGQYILVNAQCTGDAAVMPYVNFREWANETVKQCRDIFPDKEIVWRPHPVEVERSCAYGVAGARTSTGNTLAEDMAGAYAVVTFNSNSGVDAVMAGVPTYAMDKGSMAWPVTSHSLNEIPIRPDRRQWAYDLAYKQWTIEELAAGLPWSYLKEKVV